MAGDGSEHHPVPGNQGELVERHLPLARALARRHRVGDEPFEDVYQVACLALVRAVQRFDPARDVAFSSFAVPTITGEIKRHYRDRTWSVRVPRDLHDLTMRVDAAVRTLARTLGRQPTVAEIARVVGADHERILDALQAGDARRAVSLQAPRDGDGLDAGTLGDAIGADDAGYDLVEHRLTLERLLCRLPACEREVLRLRFEEDLQQAQIGARIGVSQMQVSRMLRRALGRLRDEVEASGAAA
jgi:RNA polymerase sigma-B factor